MVGARVFSLLLILLSGAANAAAYSERLHAADTGTVAYSLLGGVLDASDRRMVSSCESPAPGESVFRRGYAEFDLSRLTFPIAAATLTVRETFEVGEYAIPAALHEISWYPADLVVDAADLDVPTTPLASIVTDDADPGLFFELDVTALVKAREGGSIGFRIRLADDPDIACGAAGSLGAVFDGLSGADAPVLTLTAEEPLAVPLDIEPEQCPSPLDRHDNKLHVAISGYEQLDVRTIDPLSVRMYGVAPLKAQVRDVSTPYFPLRGKDGPLACLSEGRDGVPDLLLVFDTRAVMAAIEANIWNPIGLYEGMRARVGVVGNLTAEAGGGPFVGEDFAIIHVLRQALP